MCVLGGERVWERERALKSIGDRSLLPSADEPSQRIMPGIKLASQVSQTINRVFLRRIVVPLVEDVGRLGNSQDRVLGDGGNRREGDRVKVQRSA